MKTEQEARDRIASSPWYCRERARAWAVREPDQRRDAYVSAVHAARSGLQAPSLADVSPLVRELFWTLFLEHIWGAHASSGDLDCPHASCREQAKTIAWHTARALAQEEPA